LTADYFELLYRDLFSVLINYLTYGELDVLKLSVNDEIKILLVDVMKDEEIYEKLLYKDFILFYDLINNLSKFKYCGNYWKRTYDELSKIPNEIISRDINMIFHVDIESKIPDIIYESYVCKHYTRLYTSISNYIDSKWYKLCLFINLVYVGGGILKYIPINYPYSIINFLTEVRNGPIILKILLSDEKINKFSEDRFHELDIITIISRITTKYNLLLEEMKILISTKEKSDKLLKKENKIKSKLALYEIILQNK